jgi:hypothetical protein
MIKNTWYGNIKKSQNEQVYPLEKEMDDSVKYGPGEAELPWKKGTKIRDRRKGLVISQEYGIITNVADDYVEVEWHGKNKESKREKYNKEDLVALFSIVTKE